MTIVWSIASGKRLVLADGQEVHYSMTRGTKLEFSWTMRGNHVLKVVAHATSQVSSTPGWRQYDLFIDGQSFFGMPKVYELGIKGPVASDARAPGARSTNGYGGSSRRALPAVIEGEPRSREEEEIELAKAISASLEESRQHLKRTVESHRAQDPNPLAIAAAPAAGGDLLDFGGPAPAVPVAPALPPSTNYAPAPPVQPGYDSSFAAAAPPPAAMPPGAMVPVAPQPGAPYGGYGGAAPPQPAPQYGGAAPVVQQQPLAYAPAPAAPVPPAMDQFAAQPVPTDDPFAPKAPAPPTFNDVTSSIMGQYGGGAPPPGAPEAAPVAQQQYQQPMEQAPVQQQPPVEHYNGTNGHAEPAPAAPEGQFSNLTVNTDPNDEDGISSAMKKLINIDDIGSPVEAPLTMNPFEDEKKNKTKAIPPVSQKLGNPSASLSEMQTIKSSASGEKKMVMNSMNQTYDPSGGALVVSGTQSGGYSVPPPINRPTGFGVGIGMNGGGYGGGMGGPAPPMMQQQQQQPPMMQQQSQQMPMQQQPGYGAPPPMQQQMPMQQPPMQQPMYGQQPPPPPQQGGYSNYTY